MKRSTRSMARARDTNRLALNFDRWIEAAWLAGLVTIPLVFRGREWVAFFSKLKFVVLHGVALLIVVLWAAELALSARSRQKAASDTQASSRPGSPQAPPSP